MDLSAMLIPKSQATAASVVSCRFLTVSAPNSSFEIPAKKAAVVRSSGWLVLIQTIMLGAGSSMVVLKAFNPWFVVQGS